MLRQLLTYFAPVSVVLPYHLLLHPDKMVCRAWGAHHQLGAATSQAQPLSLHSSHVEVW